MHPPSLPTTSPRRSVIVIGDGYVARNTLSSLVARHGNTVHVVAGVPDPSAFQPMKGVRATKADLWDKLALTETLRDGNFCRAFLVLPGHSDRLQMGWNGLEAARNAGILQVVLVSVVTPETQTECPGQFRPLGDNVQTLGKIEVPAPRPFDSPTTSPLPFSKSSMVPRAEGDPSTCLRIQRRNVLHGWYPMKVKLLQISLPNLDPASRCGRPSKSMMMNPKAQDNGIAELQRAFLGPYEQKDSPKANPKPTACTAYIGEMQQEIVSRKEQLLESTRATAALWSNMTPMSSGPCMTARQAIQTAAPAALAPLPPMGGPMLPGQQPNATDLLYADVLRSLQAQRQALQQRPQWL